MTSPVSKTMISPLASIQSTLIPSLEGIDLAGRILEWQLKNDNLFPTLSDQIKIGEGENLKAPKTVLLLSFANICALFIFSSWRQWTLWCWLPHAGGWPKWTSSSQADGARQQDSITTRVGGTFWPHAELLHDGPFPPHSACLAEHRQWHLCLDLWGWVRKKEKIKFHLSLSN